MENDDEDYIYIEAYNSTRTAKAGIEFIIIYGLRQYSMCRDEAETKWRNKDFNNIIIYQLQGSGAQVWQDLDLEEFVVNAYA